VAAAVENPGTDASTEDGATNGDDAESATDLLAQVGRDISALVLCDARLATFHHLPEVRRAARDIAGTLVAALALLTAFVFLNVAAFYSLATWMSRPLAALVLAALWLAVGLALLVAVTVRAGRVAGWKWWWVFRAAPGEAEDDLRRAREEAEATVFATLERLGPAITVELAAAVVPAAGDMVGGAMEKGDDLLEASEDLVEDLVEDVPGGGVVSQMWSVFLTPGRLGLRVATTVLSAGQSESGESPTRAPSAKS
jgi:hypothetical protein